MSEDPKRGFTGIFIPVEILDNKDLKPIEMFLLAQINALDKGNDGNGCYASNEYLGNLLGVKTNTISIYISHLKELGLLEQVGFDGRRRLLSVNGRVSQTSNPAYHKCESHSNSSKSKEEIPPTPKGDGDIDRDFEEWYREYPRHKKRGHALKAYRSARKKASKEVLLSAAIEYAGSVSDKDEEFISHPASWLNGEGWLDETDKKVADTIGPFGQVIE